MTEQSQSSQTQDQKPNDKEYNFRMLEAKYEKELAQERSARMEAERIAQEVHQRQSNSSDDDDDSEPYVDHKKLNKKLAKFGQDSKKEIQTDIQRAVNIAIQEERRQNWLKQNSDFYEVMQHAEKLPQKDPELAETILKMPESFERQQLVYRNIKALGLNRPETKEPSIQDKIDSNRRGPFYQPTGVGTAPYANNSDFSQNGQQQAYQKMQELKNRMRLN